MQPPTIDVPSIIVILSLPSSDLIPRRIYTYRTYLGIFYCSYCTPCK